MSMIAWKFASLKDGIKAKRHALDDAVDHQFASLKDGIKAKHPDRMYETKESLPASRMESRQSTHQQNDGWTDSLPASRMESRQSSQWGCVVVFVSLPASRMESRQSKLGLYTYNETVCQPQGWNQGKAPISSLLFD